jgi:uncharacterized protein YndB with AHSA1/START domain
MTRVIEFLIAVSIVVALFVLVGLFLPSSRTVTHSIETNHPVRQVYDTLAGFQRFRHWNPMRQHDPKAEFDISGPRSGEGARLEYHSESPQVGDGSLEIVEAEQDSRIVLAQENEAYGTDKTHVFEIEPATSGKTLTITWTYDVDYGWNLFGRYAGLYVSRNVGEDMKRGLANLAGLIATMPNFDYADLDIAPQLVQPTNTVYVSTTAERNITAVENAMVLALRDIRRAIEANDLEEAGPFRLVTTNFGDTTYDFDIAIPVREPAPEGEADAEDAAEADDAADQAGSEQAAADAAEQAALNAATAEDSWTATGEPQAEPDPCAQPLVPAPPIDAGSLELPANVSFGPGYAGCALVTEYVGHPAALPLVRDMLRSYAAAHGYEIHQRAFEEYLSPLEEMELGNARFLVYWPVVHPNNPPPPQPEAPAEGEGEGEEAADQAQPADAQ